MRLAQSDSQNPHSAVSWQQRIGTFVETLPPWSWAECMGTSLAGLLVGILGLAITKGRDGGAFASKHRRELVAAIVMGIVGGAGAVFLTWLLKAFGIR